MSKGKKTCKCPEWLRSRARWGSCRVVCDHDRNEPGEKGAAEKQNMYRPYLDLSLWAQVSLG